MSHISAIQGLRGVAVGGVLLFHVDPNKWPLGFLGVDMFFLISGFLMCSIMSKPSASVEQFYFRRIRRIVPSYLFLIGLVLFGAAYGYISSIDYFHLLVETKKALKFAANIPNPHESNYFNQGVGEYNFLRHLWSLSTELQFYVLVPPLCFGLSKVRIPIRMIICLCIGALSFCSQILDDGDSAHMALHNRIWQFMCGFVAFYTQAMIRTDETNPSDPTASTNDRKDHPDAEKSEICRKPAAESLQFHNLLSIFLQNLIQILLVGILLADLETPLPLLRIGVLLMAGCVLVFRQHRWTLLNFPPLVSLGDISYSVYLIHWPPIHWIFYETSAPITPMVSVLIVGVSIIAGNYMEKLFVGVSNWTLSWYRLVAVLALCYFFVFVPFHYVRLNDIGINKHNARSVVFEKDKQKLFLDIDRIWKGEETGFSNKQLAVFNYQLTAVIRTMATCENRNRSAIPTKYDIAAEITFGSTAKAADIHGITNHCYETGNGTKNIVVVGNSHAMMMHFGVKKEFDGLYANLTVLSAGACPLIEWPGKLRAQNEFHRKTCFWFRDKILDVLRQWEHPIDILIVAHAYMIPYGQEGFRMDPIAPDKLPGDEYFQKLQNLFANLSTVVRDVVFIPHNPFLNVVPSPVDVLARRIVQNASLGVFRRSREEQNSRAPLDDRLKHVHCPKCVHMNWEDVWCSSLFNSCDFIDHKRRVGFFTDGNHVNAMGSLLYGRYIRRLYDEELRKSEIGEISNLGL